MKKIVALIATVAAVSAFAAEPAKTAVVAPAPTASAPAPIKTADCGTKPTSQGCGKVAPAPTVKPVIGGDAGKASVKSEPAKDQKAEAAKK